MGQVGVFLFKTKKNLEFKNTVKSFLGEVHVKSFWPKKLRGKKSFRLFPSIFFYSAFGRFSA
jgi:hypothetical protein